MDDKETATIGNDHDDWEVAVDTGEFDKRLEQQEKDRAATQKLILSSTSSTINNDDDDGRNFSNVNLITSNKPIRILKRPTSQSQLPTSNDNTNSDIITATNNNDNNSPFPNNISIALRMHTKESINLSQLPNLPSSSSSQSTKPAIKTYEQRELEYRLARLRIMGEEESSTKDDDNDNTTSESTSITSDDSTPAIKTLNKTTNSSQSSLQHNSASDSYTSNLHTVNNIGAVHFTPDMNAAVCFPHHEQYYGAYPVPYSQLSLAPSIRYPTGTIYMSSPSHSNTLYHYQQQTLYGTQQSGQPQ